MSKKSDIGEREREALERESLSSAKMEDKRTRILLAVSPSTIHGYPHPSISSREAFEFILKKIIRSDTSHFKLLILHVHCHDEDFQLVLRRGIPLLGYFDKICGEAGVLTESWIKEGYPGEVICKEVQRLRPDLLVLGSRGLNWLQRIFITSVSEACAMKSECPILIVKRKPEDTPEDSTDD